MPNSKPCRDCGQIKLLSEFYKNKRYPDGYKAECKVCASNWAKAWRKNNAEHYRALYKRQNADPKNKESRRNARFKLEYGITVAQYNELLAEQGGKCAICQGVNPSGRNLAVDHDHKSGKIRRIVCHNCNRIMGLLKDDPDLSMKIATYLSYCNRLTQEIVNG